jgi:hypothetical protein
MIPRLAKRLGIAILIKGARPDLIIAFALRIYLGIKVISGVFIGRMREFGLFPVNAVIG